MKKFLNEFKEFAMKGNMIDMSIGVVIGAAFGKIVTGLTDCIITPLIALIIGGLFHVETTDQLFGALTVGPFPIGQLISTIIDFLITAIVLFIIVKGINELQSLGHHEAEEEAAPTTKICPYCKSEIAIDAVKCPHCTSDVE